LIEVLSWKRLAFDTAVWRGACTRQQSESAQAAIHGGDRRVEIVTQIAMTLNDAVSVLRVFAQRGREVHAPPGYDARHREVPGTGFVVAVTRPDSTGPAALSIWHGREAEALARLDEDGPVMVLGGAERVVALARAILNQDARQDESQPCLSATL
jgi:hypothetical protein